MSINGTITQGLGISGGLSLPIGDTLTQSYAFGDSSIISDQDAQKIARYVHEYLVEDGFQSQELMRLLVAVCGGLLDKVGNQTPEFKSLDGSKVRLKMATDGTGNRTKRLEIDLS